MQRLARAIDATSDAELARALGISTGDYSQRKSRGRVPWDRVMSVARSRLVSADWLLTGEGEMRRQDGAVRDEPAARYQVEAESGASWERRIAMLSALLADLTPEHREALLADALSRAATAQQLAELGQALADIRESLRSGTA